MKAYSEYKDSRMEWIGKIPKNWQVSKVKYIGQVVNGATPKTSVEEYWDGNIIWITPADFKENKSKYVLYSNRKITKVGQNSCNVKLVEKGSVILSTRAPIGHIGIVENELCVGTGCKSITNTGINSEYVYYQFHSSKKILQSLGRGVTFKELSTESLKSFKIVVPNQKDQELIADFLDRKTYQISESLQKKERLVKLLKDRRTAAINQVVTKGLNKDADLKESPVEWIGRIPQHWIIKRLKFNTYIKGRIGWQALKTDEFIDEGPYCVTGTDFDNGLINWATCHHVGEERYELDKFIQLKENDLLITKDGTIGKIAIVKKLRDKACLNSGVFVIRPTNDDYLIEYMYWVLNSLVFTEFVNFEKKGTTILHLYQNIFKNLPYTQPPISEQKEIVNFLKDETSRIDNSIQKINKEIDLLQEYRDALIYEAVTGKINVLEACNGKN